MKENNPYGYYSTPDEKNDENFKLVLIEKEKLTKKGGVNKKVATGLASSLLRPIASPVSSQYP